MYYGARPSTSSRRWVGLSFAILGFGMFAVALAQGLATKRFIERARRAEGRIVSLATVREPAAIEFTDTAGRKRSFIGNGFVTHQPGERVKVLFLENDPTGSASLDEAGSLWFGASTSGMIGAAFLFVGLSAAFTRTASRESPFDRGNRRRAV